MKSATAYEKQVQAFGHSLAPNVTTLVKPAAFILLGAVCSQFDAVEGASPFSPAVVAAVPIEYCFLCFVGSCLGYLAKGSLMQALRYFIVMSLIMAVRMLHRRKPGTVSETAICCAGACVFPALGCAAHIALTEISSQAVIAGICEALLSGSACFFFTRSFYIPVLKIGAGRLLRQDAAFICVSACMIMLCASGISIGVVRPAHILGFFIILMLSHYRGCVGGALSGTVLGTVFCLTPESTHLFAMLSLGGFFSGLFSPLGQFGCSVAFTASCGMVTLFRQGEVTCLITLLEAAAASTAFAAMPLSWLMKAENRLDKSGFAVSRPVERETALSLTKAARTVSEVCDIVNSVSADMEEAIDSQTSRICARIQQSVCRTCAKKSECWGKRFDDTIREINLVAAGKADQNSMCVKTDELTQAIKRDRKAYAEFFGTKLELDELRGVVTDQFSSMSGLLTDIAERIATKKIYDFPKAGIIKQALSQADITIENAMFSCDINGRACVEITMYEDVCKIECESIRTIISEAVMRQFDLPEIALTDLLLTLTFFQSPGFKISTGVACLCAVEGDVCGDSTECFMDGDGNYISIISDGMGTGARAAVDGTMTATLMKKLIESGFSFDNALRLVNSALLVKSSDESLATVDAVKINPYTGCVSFYKAGAAASYIRNCANVHCINQASLPAGILRSISFASEEKMLESGDIILLLSDGVTCQSSSWIPDELLAWSTADMKGLASHIASLAKLRNNDMQRDDISVIAIKITDFPKTVD